MKPFANLSQNLVTLPTNIGNILPVTSNQANFNFDNSYSRDLDGFYIPVRGRPVPDPQLVEVNEQLAETLILDTGFLRSTEGIEILSGKTAPEGANPLAQAYAGHQFGGFSPSLGDGRAMLLGELIDIKGERKDIQLKGSGRTPFSRGGDGKAALGPVIREYVVSEAMHALGIPTTRALAAVTTGEEVYRETALPGAVLTRVASSHLRVGTFQYFAARGETDKVTQLADYAINRHFPNLVTSENKYLEFLKAVIRKQSELIAKWMSVGFIHGVMNTDNTTISGETIDYGPCAFMDAYKENAVFSSIDEMGRYAYRMQPIILQWNLARLAECLLNLIDPDNKDEAVRLATDEINKVPEIYGAIWLRLMGNKIGIANAAEDDRVLVEDLLELMEGAGADFTITFRSLADAISNDSQPLAMQFGKSHSAPLAEWLERWRERLDNEKIPTDQIGANMKFVNPVYIPRNHLVEEVIEAAVNAGNLEPFRKLNNVLTAPFIRQDGRGKFETGAPEDFGPYVTYCGT